MPETLPLWFRVIALAIGLSVWLVQFFVINNLRRPRRPRFVPATAVDGLVPYMPRFIVVYFSTYLFAILPPLLVSDTAQFVAIAVSYGLITVIAAATHVVFPSRVERPRPPDDDAVTTRLITWFQRLCKPYGNLPSIHVAFSLLVVVTAFVARGPGIGVLALVWAILIAASTLVTKQHYLLDVASGAALGAGVTAAVFLLL